MFLELDKISKQLGNATPLWPLDPMLTSHASRYCLQEHNPKPSLARFSSQVSLHG